MKKWEKLYQERLHQARRDIIAYENFDMTPDIIDSAINDEVARTIGFLEALVTIYNIPGDIEIELKSEIMALPCTVNAEEVEKKYDSKCE